MVHWPRRGGVLVSKSSAGVRSASPNCYDRSVLVI